MHAVPTRCPYHPGAGVARTLTDLLVEGNTMAQYYTYTCFELNASPAEREVFQELLDLDLEEPSCDRAPPSAAFLTMFPPVDEDPWSGYLEFLGGEGFEHAPDGELLPYEGSFVFCAESLDLGFLVAILQKVCTSCLPLAFSWADTRSRMDIDQYGGGCVLIEKGGIWYYNALQLLHDLRGGMIPFKREYFSMG
jgi:hypothetical protein